MKGRITVGHRGGAEWFVHSTREVLQKIEIMNGRMDLPETIEPLLVHNPLKFDRSAIRPDFYAGTDVFVVEVSSIKNLRANGWHLQQWCVRDILSGSRQVSEATHAIVDGARQHVQSAQELRADIQAIVAALHPTPVAFVPHLTIPRDDGSPFPERTLIRDVLLSSSVTTIDPTPWVLGAGYDLAMVDSGHYRPSFEIEVGSRLVAEISARFG
jgi:hypothetical protein